ncbi:class I SAM-dependent methyltransferase [Limnobacter humi]|uniref:Class I SAM-dependent methyltransferase n=1 Tax=Limnobacter humi TaxID=1778671 RepID=A0ABT1WLC9_9BURK|nr:methyltransferase domain-containing protein [Limnobacter humi]MCQ8897654.1 class I SAM-dependent methyltransferase [Limnobacter humi]
MGEFWKIERSNAAWVRQWARRVRGPAPFILDEVNRRMVDRAQIMRPAEGGVLHQGWLHPAVLGPVETLFEGREFMRCAPEALPLLPPDQHNTVVGVLSRLWAGWGKSPASTTAVLPSQPVPLPDASMAMVWSPLWLHHVADPAFQVQEWHRILKPDGGLFFSLFGPDTATELAGVAQALGVAMPDFPDMHDVGDLLSRLGFSDPVMEMEKLTLTYAAPQALLADWRALMGNNLLALGGGVSTGLRGKTALTQALAELEGLRQNDTGRIPLTLELVYGHAWKVERAPKPGLATVRLQDIGGRRGAK